MVVRQPGSGLVRVDDSHRFPQGLLDVNAVFSDTVGHFNPNTSFPSGIGLNTGLVVTSSNASNSAGITVEYE